MPFDLPGFLYAGAVAAGGILGYYKAGNYNNNYSCTCTVTKQFFHLSEYRHVIVGSVPSLAAGLVFGGALAYGAFKVSQDPSNYSFQLATSSILAGIMGYRFYNSGKIMPAGVVCLLSVGMITRIALKASGLTGGVRSS